MPKTKTTEQFIKEASILHSNRYDYSKSEYIGAHDKLIITCREHGNFSQTPRNHLFGRNKKGQGCSKCMIIEKSDNLRFNNKKIDDYLIKNNRNIKRIDDYKNSYIKMKWECTKCNLSWTTSSNSIRQGSGCPNCNDTTLDNEYIDSFIKKHSLLINRIDNYVNSQTKINWKCLQCNNVWLAQPCEITRLGKRTIGSGCPNCAKYKNEKIVGEYLKSNNIINNKLKIILNNGQKIFPDFYIPKLNLIIEYNGVQHYQPTCFGSMTIPSSKIVFQKQLNRDSLLRKHCQENKINLLEIDGRVYKGISLKNFLSNYFK